MVGGWVNATSVASGSNHFRACLITRFLGTDGKWSDLQYNEFAPQRVGWKYDEWAIKAPKAYKEFRRNTGTTVKIVFICNLLMEIAFHAQHEICNGISGKSIPLMGGGSG